MGLQESQAFFWHRKGIRVNRKKAYMFMNCGLTVSKETKKRPERFKPRAERHKQHWDKFTKFMINSRLVGLIWSQCSTGTRKRYSDGSVFSSRYAEWKCVLDMALNNEFPDDVRGNGLKAHKRQRMSIHILQLHERHEDVRDKADVYFLRQSNTRF